MGSAIVPEWSNRRKLSVNCRGVDLPLGWQNKTKKRDEVRITGMR